MSPAYLARANDSRNCTCTAFLAPSLLRASIALILNGDQNNFATVSLHGFIGVRCDTGMVVRRCYLRFLAPNFNAIHLFSVISVSVATFSGVSPKVFHGLFETLNNVVTGLINFQVLIILNEILFLFASLSKKLPNLLTLNSLCLHRHQ